MATSILLVTQDSYLVRGIELLFPDIIQLDSIDRKVFDGGADEYSVLIDSRSPLHCYDYRSINHPDQALQRPAFRGTMSSELSILELMLDASAVVQAVMLILIAASIVSWTYIFAKYRDIKRAEETTDEFEERFWSGIDLADLYRQLAREDYATEGVENIFMTGFKEFARLRQEPNIGPDAVMEGAQRVMRVSLNRELDLLDRRLPFLATVGSTSPYIGLFGTVWGIMNAFRSLGAAKQATLAMVAPGIAEALVATAMGLFAAIPAVMAYNRYATEIGRLASRYEAFADEFLSLLHRKAHAK